MGVSPLKSYLETQQKYWSGSKRNRARDIKASKEARREAANAVAQEVAASIVDSGLPDDMGPGES